MLPTSPEVIMINKTSINNNPIICAVPFCSGENSFPRNRSRMKMTIQPPSRSGKGMGRRLKRAKTG